MTTPPRTAADRHPLEQHLGEIWNALSFDAKLALMNRGRGLDPIIAALRAAPSPMMRCPMCHFGDASELFRVDAQPPAVAASPATPMAPIEIEYTCGCTYRGHLASASCPVHPNNGERKTPSPAAGEPADRDPIVLAAEAMRGMCAHALRRAMAATETLPGTLPLTAEECITIVENFAIPAVPVADAQVSASAQPSAPYAQEQAGEPAEMRPRCATCVSWVKRSDESNGLCREMSTLPSIQLRTRPEFGCVLHKETP